MGLVVMRGECAIQKQVYSNLPFIHGGSIHRLYVSFLRNTIKMLGAKLNEGLVLNSHSGHHDARAYIVGLDKIVKLTVSYLVQRAWALVGSWEKRGEGEMAAAIAKK